MTDDLEKNTISQSETYEPSDETAPASSVLPPDPASRGAQRRWVIAVGVVALVVVASAFAFSLFAGRAANAVVLGYVPEDSIMYGEIRMDLPGDQRANVGAFLSKFPGFADQSTMETKIDEVLDRIVGEASSGSQTFSQDVKPWFGGEVAFSVGALPDPAAVGTEPVPMEGARFLLLTSVKDEVLAKAWFDGVIAESGEQTATETYNGVAMTLFSAHDEPDAAYAIVGGKVAVAGDATSVRAAIDTNGGSAFASSPEPKAALDATTGDHVGFVYIALRPLIDWSSSLAESGGAAEMPSEALLGAIPDWSAFALRVEGDALLMEAISPRTATQTATANRTSAIVDRVPGNAIALSISHDYGQGLLTTLDTFRSEPELAEVVEAIDGAMEFLGGSDEAVGWIGDVGVAVTQADGGIEGGLIVAPTDSNSAKALFSSLHTLASLGGLSMGIEVRDEPYAGTTITVIDLGSLSDLAGVAGVPPDMQVLGEQPLGGNIELAYAVTDDLVIIGAGPGFVQRVLDTTPETSLASTDRYRAVLDRAGAGSGVAYVDISAIRALLESAMAGTGDADVASYEQEIKPFLEPFDVLVSTTSNDGTLNRSTTIITVK